MSKIITKYLRNVFVWEACREGGALVGTGTTEKAAVIDLLEQELAEQGIQEMKGDLGSAKRETPAERVPPSGER